MIVFLCNSDLTKSTERPWPTQARRQVVITWGHQDSLRGHLIIFLPVRQFTFFSFPCFSSPAPSTVSQTTQTKFTKLSSQQNYLFTLSTHNSYYSICNWTTVHCTHYIPRIDGKMTLWTGGHNNHLGGARYPRVPPPWRRAWTNTS